MIYIFEQTDPIFFQKTHDFDTYNGRQTSVVVYSQTLPISNIIINMSFVGQELPHKSPSTFHFSDNYFMILLLIKDIFFGMLLYLTTTNYIIFYSFIFKHMWTWSRQLRLYYSIGSPCHEYSMVMSWYILKYIFT